MTQEEKQLLFRELCSRLPYGVICNITICNTNMGDYKLLGIIDNTKVRLDCNSYYKDEDENIFDIIYIRPYLRPMSSMTEEEKKEEDDTIMMYLGDFYCSKHIDYHHLIEKGIALEAPNGMYKI